VLRAGAIKEQAVEVAPVSAPVPERPLAGRWLAGWPGGAGLLAVTGAVAVWVLSGGADAVGLDRGAALDVVLSATGLGLVVGVARRPARWWATWGIGLACGAAAAVGVARWWLRHSGLVVDHYPPTFLLWVGLALWAVGVALTGWWSDGMAVRVVRVLAAPAALLAAFLLINSHYGYWPTVGALVGAPVPGQVSSRALVDEFARRGELTQLRSLAGQYGPVDIPGSAVGFHAAQAYVWLPPDYFHVRHANLSVLVMLPGWPGNVQDWTRAGGVTATADSWARAHGGRAPVMVFIDENGASGNDTECVDSPEGNAASYLSRVVPDFITSTLGITPAAPRWGLVGFSEGGTCALGLALEHPHLFGRFVDIAGDLAPNYGTGDPVQTLRLLYGGSRARERAGTPLVLMAHHRYRGLDAWFAAGNDDKIHRAEMTILARSARRAGIHVHAFSSPGGHSWIFARQTFNRVYPSLVHVLAPGPGATGAYPVVNLNRVVSRPAGRSAAGRGHRKAPPPSEA
jgi:S-formylglutathione hydrolase FrmB